ncbi:MULTISPECIES: iron-sulfur cluster biosynthesis family protein [Paenibacillus]|uniref:Core domain-containing protein n=1 Tax=Paenibacillus radicis (ex Xue et al. 2023) TaxID=2972489 RepID=A0ABT1YFH4_9BACL|nr:iron-sulfur cluster biosynthesis family protein [Paenibacillus radicis (ex Xue et al. 2023)]MCR8631943.1 hypothetical protein [Paenibacillus radicis (ex Xue et al. 2023)]
MHITFTNQAIEQINKKMTTGAGELKLVYDSEGCGCAANGVPTLWIVNHAEDKELRAEGTPFELVYEKKHEVYFEDRMTLDYEAGRGSFVLKSSGQIYNANMLLIDKREQQL